MNEEQLKIVINAANNTKGVFTQVSSQLKTVSAKMEAVGRKTTQAGRSLAPLSLAFTAVAGIGVKAFATLDKAMTESTSIMGNVTDETREKMKKLAEEMSTKFPYAADQAAEAYFYLASAGLDAQQSMAALPAMMNFATAGAFDLATATDLVTDAQSALGLTVDDSVENMENMVRVSDVLVKANTLANGSVQQFSEALTADAAASMRAYNIELEDGVAVLAAYADQGKKGAEAGNMFGRMSRLLMKSARENREEFEKMNIAVYDTRGELNSFADIIGDMERAFDGMAPKQREAALNTLGFQALVQKTIIPLLGASKQIKEYGDNLRAAGGITEEVAQKQLKGFTNQMKTTWNTIKVATAGLMEQLVPAMKEVGEKIKYVAQKFNDLDPRTKKIIATVVVLVAALAPLLIIFGQLAIAIAALLPVIGAVSGAFLALAANPIGALILALAAIPTIIRQGIKAFEDIRVVSQKELNAMSLNVELHTKLVRRSLNNVLNDEAQIASQIEGVSRQLVDAKKAGMRDVIKAKEAELGTLLALEKQGALDRIAVLQAEMDATHTKQNELYDQLDELASKKENPILGALFGKQYDKKRAQIKEDLLKLNAQTTQLISASNKIRDISSSANKIVSDTSSPLQASGASSETSIVIEESNRIVQDAEKKTADVTDEMVDDMTTGYNNLEGKVGDSVDFLVKKNEQLRSELAKFKALTAPKEGADNRKFSQIVAQAGVPDPTSGGVFSPAQQGFTKSFPDMSREEKRAARHITDDPNTQTIVNINNPVVDSEQRTRNLIEGLKTALGRSYKQATLGSS